MPFIDQQYVYTYDKAITAPLDCLQNEDGEIQLLKANTRPLPGFSVLNQLITESNSQRKFIYTVRHGKAQHNAMAKKYTKPIAWRFLPKLLDNFDPSLTVEGFQDAHNAGKLLRELIAEEKAPRPVNVYTSPLRRCIQTAMHAIAALQFDRKVKLCVREGLREWKGFDHDHQSDRRDITPNILKLFNELKQQLNLDIEIDFDNQQDDEDDLVMRETYVDVDRRIRKVLDDIFDNDTSSCCMLVLHNRSNKSVLREFGHTQDEVHKLDLENCATLGYFVERSALSWSAGDIRLGQEEDSRHGDKTLALEEKQARHEQAARDIEAYRGSDVAKLRELSDYLVERAVCKGDDEARKAMMDLFALAPEMKPALSK